MEPRFATANVVVVGDDLHDVRLVLRPTATFAGRVTLDGNATIEAHPMRVQMQPVDIPIERAPFARNIGRVEKDGTFAVRGLLPGRYRVTVMPNSDAPLPWEIESVALRGTGELTDQIIDVRSAELVENVAIVLRRR